MSSEFDALYRYAETPIAARAYQIPTQLLLVLREYFTPSYRQYIPGVDRYVYAGPDGPTAADQLVSAIEIHRIGDKLSDTTELPKLLIRRNAAADTTQGLRHGMRNLDREHIFQTASSTTIFAMSRVQDEADLLGFEVFELLRHMALSFQHKNKLARFRSSQIGEVGSLRKFPGFFAVPVTVDYLYRDTVRITSDRFPIRELKLSLKSQ